MFDFYSNIENYLSGKLSDTQKVAFDKAIEEDKELKKIGSPLKLGD